MSDIPAWSVVVVVFNKHEHVLAISRNFNPRDPGLPDGDSLPTDQTPAQTAARVLFEKTGLTALELRCVDQWEGSLDQQVYVFVVPRWKGARPRTTDSGKPFWTAPEGLFVRTALFREEAKRIFDKLHAMVEKQ